MADVYCDQALATGLNDGTTWANAYQLLSGALDAANVVAGDTLWVKNDFATAGATALKGIAAYSNDPPQVIGVLAATTNAPPVAADLVPGLRTGSTLAYAQTGANAPPTLTCTTAGADVTINGWLRMYGIVIKAQDNFGFGQTLETVAAFEECEFRAGNGETGLFLHGSGSAGLAGWASFKNCKISGGTSGQIQVVGKNFACLYEHCVIDVPATPIITPGSVDMRFDSCDFSSQTGAILGSAGGLNPQATYYLHNCKINASSASASGSITEKFRAEFLHTSSATGKTTGGSFQEIEILTDNGAIVHDTTHFRTGGADDGSAGTWALAFTPEINGTRDNREGLIGPWMAVEVTGDGTAQTLSVSIANSSASTDYQDDEVWLEVFSPESAAGDADYDFTTSQMNLLGTAANIADDTGSTWGTGANNHQTLSVSISPDYDGFVRCRVIFAKNFGASPETLYVDPLPVLS